MTSARTMDGPASRPHSEAAGMHLAEVVTLVYLSRLLTLDVKIGSSGKPVGARLSSGSARGTAPPAFTLASPGMVRAMRG